MKQALILSASVMGILAATAPAFAQIEDEIIVTATKRAQSVQDVPIAVTVISPKILEDQGVVNIQNLESVAPSFSTSNAQTSSGTVVLRMRGVGTTSNNIGFESAVGVFIDGIYQSRSGVALGEFVDVERVEVLRGPQGTLFGRNTSAGALNITNVRPDLDETGGFFNLTYGNYNHQSFQGAINIPLVEGKVAARLTGALRERDGFIDLVDRNGASLGQTNEISQAMIRGQIGFETNGGITGRLIADYSQSDASCCGAIEVLRSPVETAGLFGAVGLGARGGMTGQPVAIDGNDNDAAEAALSNLTGTANQLPENSSDQFGFVAEIDIPLSDNIDATYIGSYREFDSLAQYDSAFSGLDLFNVLPVSPTNIDTMTHELRFQGDAMGGRLDWLVGGYYSDEDINQVQNFGLGANYSRFIDALLLGGTGGAFPSAGILGAGGTLPVLSGGGNPAAVRSENAFEQNSKSWSLFTHNIFDITDDLSVTVGLRYSDESKTGSFQQLSNTNDVCPGLLNSLRFTPTGPAFGPTPPSLFGTLLATGCFAFTAPADLPQSAVLPLPRSFNSDFNDEELIYTGKLSYELGQSATAYASFTHGYKSGGFNLDSTAAIPVNGVSDPTFDSEEVDAYELGLKTKLFDNRVTLNIAAFFQEFTDFQVLEFTGAQFQTFNVPKAETKGVEIEASGRLTDNLSFSGGLTLLDAKYPDDCATAANAVRVQNLCGFSLTNAPKTVGIFGARYERDLNEHYNFFLSAQARYTGDRRTSTQGRAVPNAAAITAAGSVDAAIASAALNPLDIQESSVKVNMRAGIGSDDGGWSLEAWATNLTNEVTRGVTFGTTLRSGSRSAFAQEPRMYGVTVRKDF
jgi:iron complex outermembrane receptor protein